MTCVEMLKISSLHNKHRLQLSKAQVVLIKMTMVIKIIE